MVLTLDGQILARWVMSVPHKPHVFSEKMDSCAPNDMAAKNGMSCFVHAAFHFSDIRSTLYCI